MTDLQTALDSIQSLSPKEKTSLRTLLDRDDLSEADFADQMVALGILERRQKRGPAPSFEPAETTGTRASEIIIEDRR